MSDEQCHSDISMTAKRKRRPSLETPCADADSGGLRRGQRERCKTQKVKQNEDAAKAAHSSSGAATIVKSKNTGRGASYTELKRQGVPANNLPQSFEMTAPLLTAATLSPEKRSSKRKASAIDNSSSSSSLSSLQSSPPKGDRDDGTDAIPSTEDGPPGSKSRKMQYMYENKRVDHGLDLANRHTNSGPYKTLSDDINRERKINAAEHPVEHLIHHLTTYPIPPNNPERARFLQFQIEWELEWLRGPMTYNEKKMYVKSWWQENRGKNPWPIRWEEFRIHRRAHKDKIHPGVARRLLEQEAQQATNARRERKIREDRERKARSEQKFLFVTQEKENRKKMELALKLDRQNEQRQFTKKQKQQATLDEENKQLETRVYMENRQWSHIMREEARIETLSTAFHELPQEQQDMALSLEADEAVAAVLKLSNDQSSSNSDSTSHLQQTQQLNGAENGNSYHPQLGLWAPTPSRVARILQFDEEQLSMVEQRVEQAESEEQSPAAHDSRESSTTTNSVSTHQITPPSSSSAAQAELRDGFSVDVSGEYTASCNNDVANEASNSRENACERFRNHISELLNQG